MVKVSSDAILDSEARLRPYLECPKCGADFDSLVLGGDGDWKKTITCGDCFHIQRGIPYDSVLLPLIARQYGISVQHARDIEEAGQRKYLRILAKETEYGQGDKTG